MESTFYKIEAVLNRDGKESIVFLEAARTQGVDSEQILKRYDFTGALSCGRIMVRKKRTRPHFVSLKFPKVSTGDSSAQTKQCPSASRLERLQRLDV
jgi:hypothetical protein